MVTILVYWTLGLVHSVKLTSDTHCPHVVMVQQTALTFPSYFILLVTAVRVVFVRRPLTYHTYLKLRYQGAAVAAIVALVVGVNCLPLMGVCPVRLYKRTATHPKYCGYGEEGMECTIFKGTLLTVCYLVPIATIYTLYIVVHWTVVKARKNSYQLTKGYSASTSKNSSSSELTQKARLQIPWSIVAVVSLYTASTLPWMCSSLVPREISKIVKSHEFGYQLLILDVLYSLLLICTALSPLTYLLTSNTMRNEVKEMVKSVKARLLFSR